MRACVRAHTLSLSLFAYVCVLTQTSRLAPQQCMMYLYTLQRVGSCHTTNPTCRCAYTVLCCMWRRRSGGTSFPPCIFTRLPAPGTHCGPVTVVCLLHRLQVKPQSPVGTLAAYKTPGIILPPWNPDPKKFGKWKAPAADEPTEGAADPFARPAREKTPVRRIKPSPNRPKTGQDVFSRGGGGVGSSGKHHGPAFDTRFTIDTSRYGQPFDTDISPFETHNSCFMGVVSVTRCAFFPMKTPKIL